MDPNNYAAHSLPMIEYEELESSKMYYVLDDLQYTEFQEVFTGYVSGDCHAITYDDEIIYNSYKDLSIKEHIQEDIIRSNIIDDPHASIFVHLFRKNKRARVILYMFGENPWFMACYYNDNIITTEFYKSKKFTRVFQN